MSENTLFILNVISLIFNTIGMCRGVVNLERRELIIKSAQGRSIYLS
jgi:hypothetical protein